MKKLGKFTLYTPDVNPFLEDIVYSEIERVEAIKSVRLAEIKGSPSEVKNTDELIKSAIELCDEILRDSLESVDTETLKRVLFFRNEKGDDWYSLLPSITNKNVKIAYDGEGMIRALSRDPQCLVPSDLSVAVLAPSEVPELLSEELVADGPDLLQRWQLVKNKVVLSPAYFTGKRDQLVRKASAKTLQWQTQLMLGIISDEDRAQLINWMKYIQALQALDLSAEDGIEWPEAPDDVA